MSILENIVGQITSNAVGGISKPQDFNLNDDTFAKLLLKASEVSPIAEQNDMISNLGAPAGFQIEPIEAGDTVQSVEFNTEDFEIKDLKICEDYFTNLMNDNSNVMNFAIKHAANAYNVFGKGCVDTLDEFVGDVASLIK